MALRLHYQSDSLTARRVSVPTASKPYSTGVVTVPALVTKTSEIGVIGSTYLGLNSIVSGGQKTIRFVGYGNVDSMTSGVSVLIRMIPRFTGFSPSSFGGMFTFHGTLNVPYIMMRSIPDGRFQVIGINSDFSTMINFLSVSTHSFTSGTAVDIVFTWTGTTAANGLKIYVNGTLLVQGTAAGASIFSDARGQFFESIMPNVAWPQTDFSGSDLNEFAVWNEVIDPTSGGLNLVGPARTSFVTSTPATAVASLPAVGEVKSGVLYGIDNALTGTRTSPLATQVKNGIQYGAGGNEFTGNVTLPSTANVFAGVQYGANGNEFTGALSVSATDPGVDNVLEGIAYNILGVNKVGTYKTVGPEDVRYPLTFGPNGSLIGQSGQPSSGLNPYWAPLETQKSIYDYLATDETLIELLGEVYGDESGEVLTSNRVFDHVPDNTRFPYVRMQILPFVARDNATKEGFEVEFQIDVWYRPGKSTTTGRGNKQVQLIQQRVDQLLQNREICIDGWNSISILRTYIDIIRQDDNVTLQGVQRFKLLLGGK